MKTKWKVISVLSFIAIFLLVTGAAPMIFSEVVYGCNLDKTLALGNIEQVTEHKITQQYFEKYELNSTSTSRSRSLEWGYGTVEYSSYFGDLREGWTKANLKIIVDQCGFPQEFQFQCVDSEDKVWISLNSKNDNVLDYLQNENCFEAEN